MNFRNAIIISFIFLFLASSIYGCGTSRQQIMASSESQVKLRSIQSRVFDTTDKEKTLRTIIATLQDLAFVIDKADETLGTVSATKVSGTTIIKMTVAVRPKGQTQLVVRANAQHGLEAVEDPEPYQQFFESLQKAMFLTAHMEN